MDKIWQAANGIRSMLILLGLIIAGALWAQNLSAKVDQIDSFGTKAGRKMERRLQRMEQNILLLGQKWNVPMEAPPSGDSGQYGQDGDGSDGNND